MNINFFKKKDIMSEEEKQLLKIFCIFYENNKNLFVNIISNQKEKRKIISIIYNLMGFSEKPTLSDNQEEFISNQKLYRGISAENNELLCQYINEFINGEPFYGGRASIYGTGIYTVLGNDKNVANKYASDGDTNDCGIIIESILSEDSKVIEYSKIDSIREKIINKLRRIYSNEIINFLEILQDDGLFSAILGYDAIFVEDKNYMVVLNRQKMIVNSNSISNIKVNNESYPKR